MNTWEDLDYWKSGEWQWVQEKLDEFDRAGVLYNPPRHLLFKSMDACPFDTVRVAIIGQDPYPSRGHATGIAFSIPESESNFPPTLVNIMDELCSDLGVTFPSHGNLIDWCKQGVFLWNATPSCTTGLPSSHCWEEWAALTAEVVKRLSEKPIDVFVFMGRYAQTFSKHIVGNHTDVGTVCNNVICTSHPSPLGYLKGNTPFKGSRVFSHINSYLTTPIDWRLEDGPCDAKQVERLKQIAEKKASCETYEKETQGLHEGIRAEASEDWSKPTPAS
jgi:uracil-DNA glycosylase